jgi:hypothetical protein
VLAREDRRRIAAEPTAAKTVTVPAPLAAAQAAPAAVPVEVAHTREAAPFAVYGASTGTADNELIDTSFDRASSLISGSGNVNVSYTVRAQVSDSGGPLELAEADFVSSDLSESAAGLMTDAAGNTAYTSALKAYTLTSANISENSGGFNPYTLTVQADGYSNRLVDFDLNQPQQTVTVSLSRPNSSHIPPPAPPTDSIERLETIPATCTPQRDIQLKVYGSDIRHIKLSNEPLTEVQGQWSGFSPPAATFAWNLPPGDGTKTVYAIGLDASDKISIPRSIEILLDTAAGCQNLPTEPVKPPAPGTILLKAGTLIKGTSDTVYYYGTDGKRHIFPNLKTYKSWYSSFDSVIKVTDGTLSGISLGNNATYRPGNLIKFRSPAVYLVGSQATLHHIASERVALQLVGPNWGSLVQDLSDVFYMDYILGFQIQATDNIDLQALQSIMTLNDAAGYKGGGKETFGQLQ